MKALCALTDTERCHKNIEISCVGCISSRATCVYSIFCPLNISLNSFLQGKSAEAQPLFERALAINEVALGVDHPSTITFRAGMADLYQKQGLLDKALPLLDEVASSLERALGPDHRDVASALSNRACLLRSQVTAKRWF